MTEGQKWTGIQVWNTPCHPASLHPLIINGTSGHLGVPWCEPHPASSHSQGPML